jgi:hypothetical protein
MRFKSSKHEGKTTEQVLLKKPDFAQWLIEQHPESPHARAFIRRTHDFDDRFAAPRPRYRENRAAHLLMPPLRLTNRFGGSVFSLCSAA